MCVTVEFSRSLTARIGTHEARVGVREGETLGDVIRRLADEYGPQVRSGLLERGRLRSDTIASREVDGRRQSITLDTPVESGDTLRFELTSEYRKSRPKQLA
ncbi:hypothetical protein BRC83_02735 [Halobacteriales archaeon QS_1_68_17]|nr:MAG: hypothetical protein BRC83_02735 [Halobacteriales archaeon QS_1_68_17]